MAKTATEGDAPREWPVVYLGNRKTVEVLRDGDETTRRAVPGKRCTTVVVGEREPGVPLTLMEAAQVITSPQGVWAAHSDAPAPAWVASNDPALAQLLANHYGCELRQPEPQEG